MARFHVGRRLRLSRRAFLRGAGASLALPWLDAMLPALGRSAPPPVLRALFVFAPNGKKMDEWTPKEAGALGELPYLLEPLLPMREHLLVLSGLALDGARAHGDGPGDHARAAGAFLTCMHPKKTGGADIRAGTSIDQVLARHWEAATRLPSLELGMEPGRAAGICDSGYSCAYTHHVAWRDPTTPLAKQTNPRDVFEGLFGDPEVLLGDEQALRRRARRQSVLDAARDDARRLQQQLGEGDRERLDGYLTAVRELEKRLQRADHGPKVAVPAGLLAPADFPERLDLMYALIALAFETDSTRAVTFMLGNAGSNLSYPFLDVANGHHALSHHGRKPENLEGIRRINRFHVERLAAFLGRLRATNSGSSSLLDQCIVVYGSGIGDGDRHNHNDLPILVAGHGGGWPMGRHLASRRDTPLANLYLSILGRAGVEATRFGDSSGELL
jgi:hypothetical protein